MALVRQAVSSPVVDDSESDHNHLLDMMGMERPLVTRLLPKPAALNATAALCHMARSDAAREHMAHVRLQGAGQRQEAEGCVRMFIDNMQVRPSGVTFICCADWCGLCTAQVGLMEVLFDAHHGQNQNPLKERCKMLLNLLVRLRYPLVRSG